MMINEDHNPPPLLRVAVLGSTGSIGTQTLETIEHLNALHALDKHPTRYEIVALAARENTAVLAQQSAAHPSASLGVCCPNADTSALDQSKLIHAANAPTTLVEQSHPDLVLGAIVGIAGLPSTLRAAQLGINIALANKESLVAAGHLVTQAAIKNNAALLPVDSEHAGLHQCLLALTGPHYTPPAASPIPNIKRVTLTASGGPFRNATLDQIQHATPDQALNHPTWNMGKKVTIDSATLVNKGLELIEAHWLFGLSADQLDAVIHPQSTIHALVETNDASILAHLGPTDMRCPIQHALTHPNRAPAQATSLDLANLGSLDFQPIDPARFPAINLAKRVIAQADSAGVVFNAANEAAVEAFLSNQINFGAITQIIERTLDQYSHHPIDTLDSVVEAHDRSISIATQHINSAPLSHS
jgi:1-deoxy-D-xylulose-5-phosphate reductoisomerase